MHQSVRPTDRSRWLALAVLSAGTLMVILDQTVVTVALPSIQRELGFSPASLAWVINAYLIAFGGLLLLAGRLGDLIGRKRVFIGGLAIFTAASLLCGLATNPAMLIAARFVQGIGGATASAVILGMVVTLFPLPRERATAIGTYSAVQATGGTIGLLAGGVLTDVLSWHWIFFVNLPIGIAAVVLAARLLAAECGGGVGAGADVAGAVLVTAALMLGVYTIVKVDDYGWGAAHTLGFGTAALVLLGGFLLREGTAANPLLPLSIFRSRTVAGANLVQFLLVAGMFGFQFVSVLYLQRVLGYGAMRSGLAMAPIAAAIGAISLGVSARLNTRFGERSVLLAGLALIVAGLALLGRAPVGGAYGVDVLPAMLLIGVGFGMAMPALMALGMTGATTSDSGVVSGLFNTTQQVGGALGLSILAVVATMRTGALLSDGAGTATALTGGYHLAFNIAAGIVLASAVLAATVVRPAPAAVKPESDVFREPSASQVPCS